MSPLKVVFVLGAPRSGSTLLGRALGEVGGWFDAGEVRNLWSYPLHRRCKCGSSHERCPVWGPAIGAALEEAAARSGGAEAALEHVAAWHRRVASSPRHLPGLWWRLRGGRRDLPVGLAAYVHTLAAVYRRLAEVTGCGTIVDTSKLPSDLAATLLVPGIETFVVLLVRDPRGYVAARCRHRSGHRRAVVAESLAWAGLAAAAEALCRDQAPQRWLPLRYEDLVAEPRAELARVVGHVEPGAVAPAVDEGRIDLPAGHALVGKGPWAVGRVALEEDRRWERELSAADRRVVTALTAPAMARWRYLAGHGARPPAPAPSR